jgi:hypothetical protein
MGSVKDDHSSSTGTNFSNSVANSISNAWNNAQSSNSAWNEGESGSVNNATSSTDSFNQGVTGAQGTTSQNVWGPQAGTLQSIYGQAGNLAAGQGQPARDAAGVNSSARAAWEQSLQPGGNPYFSQNVQGAIDQATQGFKRQVIPGLTEAGVGAGAYGTSRDALARGEAAGLAQQGIQNMTGQMYAQQYGVDEQRRANALNLAPQMQGMNYAPLTTAAGIVGGPTVLGSSQNTSYGNTVGGSTGQSLATGSSYGNTAGGSRGQSTTAGGSHSRSGARSQSKGNTAGRSAGNEFGILSK